MPPLHQYNTVTAQQQPGCNVLQCSNVKVSLAMAQTLQTAVLEGLGLCKGVAGNNIALLRLLT